MKIVPALSFPTTVYFVDDDIAFLNSILLNLSTDTARFKTFADPMACLRRLNAEFRPDPYEMNWVARGEDFYFEHRMTDVNVPDLHKEVYNADRFDQVSVIVVDYQMPGMNGVDFCASINNKFIIKILLTGQSDENVAIDAFNRGLIHKYIRKHDPNLIEVLNLAIQEAQEEYFRKLTQDINRTVLLPPEDTALSDPTFVEFLTKQARVFGAVEHYLCEATGSFLFVNARGELGGVYVATDSMIDSLLEIAESDVPALLFDDLKNRRKMLCFHRRDSHALPHGSEWENFVFPVTKVQGRQTYYCAIAPNIFDVDQTRIQPFVPPNRGPGRKISSEEKERPLTSRQSELHSLSC